MENPDLVLLETGVSQGETHSRLAECGSRKAIQARPDYPFGVVPPRGLPIDVHLVASTTNRPVYHEVQQQITSVCFTSARPPTLLGSGYTQPLLGSGPLCLAPSSHSRQSGGKITLGGEFFRLLHGCSTSSSSGMYCLCPAKSLCACLTCPIYQLGHSIRLLSGIY